MMLSTAAGVVAHSSCWGPLSIHLCNCGSCKPPPRPHTAQMHAWLLTEQHVHSPLLRSDVDVLVQMDAKHMAEEVGGAPQLPAAAAAAAAALVPACPLQYNRTHPPKQLDMMQVCCHPLMHCVGCGAAATYPLPRQLAGWVDPEAGARAFNPDPPCRT